MATVGIDTSKLCFWYMNTATPKIPVQIFLRSLSWNITAISALEQTCLKLSWSQTLSWPGSSLHKGHISKKLFFQNRQSDLCLLLGKLRFDREPKITMKKRLSSYLKVLCSQALNAGCWKASEHSQIPKVMRRRTAQKRLWPDDTLLQLFLLLHYHHVIPPTEHTSAVPRTLQGTTIDKLNSGVFSGSLS